MLNIANDLSKILFQDTLVSGVKLHNSYRVQWGKDFTPSVCFGKQLFGMHFIMQIKYMYYIPTYLCL